MLANSSRHAGRPVFLLALFKARSLLTVIAKRAGRVLPLARKPSSRRAATSFGRQSAVAACTTSAVVVAAFALLARSLVRNSSGKSKTRYSTSSKLPYPEIVGHGRSSVAAPATIGTQERECQQVGTPKSGEWERRQGWRGFYRSGTNYEESVGAGSIGEPSRSPLPGHGGHGCVSSPSARSPTPLVVAVAKRRRTGWRRPQTRARCYRVRESAVEK